ncbi:sortase [candidate division WWE3 bacterium]|nr:sortase [candidate division WWE3 bacterium]
MKNSKNHYSFQLMHVAILLRGIAVGLLFLGGTMAFVGAYPILFSEIHYEINQQAEAKVIENTTNMDPNRSNFGEILRIAPILRQTPVNTTNAIVIDQIEVNVPVVWDVSVVNKNDYNSALKIGVAHAAGTSYPSQNDGNTYLFSHSTLNPLEIEKYSAAFTLLHRLEIGDKIVVFRDNHRYDYVVEQKEVVKGFNTDPLTRQPDYPQLTLQTCDPPGIPLNRLIITSRMVADYEVSGK